MADDHCPVCRARFRGARACSRCGVDLEPLMRLTLEAWRLRQAAREALDRGDFERHCAWPLQLNACVVRRAARRYDC